MDRQEFVKICDKEIQDAEEFMKENFIKISHSYDFDLAYRTISPTARKVSQMSFLDLYRKGKLYRKEEPIIWDVVDQTALAQTEAEDKEIESQMNYIEFGIKPIEKKEDLCNLRRGTIGILFQNYIINSLLSKRPLKSHTIIEEAPDSYYPYEFDCEIDDEKYNFIENDLIIKNKNILFSSTRLYFRHVNPNSNKDIEMLVNMHNNGEIMKFVGFPNGIGTDFNKEQQQRLREKGTLEELIFCYDKLTNYCIGYCKVGEPGVYRQTFLKDEKLSEIKINKIEDKVVCIDYKLKKEYWGKGYGTEIVSNLINYIYNTLNLDVIVQTDPNVLNTASVKICEKCGFEKTGIFKTFNDTNGEECKVETLKLTRENFTGINVNGVNDNKLIIMTTRPELLPACVAIFAHPDDFEKYQGKVAITPLGVEVPILFDESVEKDKGTGVMMCCTFGDGADVEKYKKYNLPLKMIIDENGCLYFDNVPEIAEKYKTRLNGLFTTKAREEILNILQEEGKIAKSPEKITHNVKVGERSKSPLEILVKSQWNIDVLSIKDELHNKAHEIKWRPEWMENRIHSWIDGLSWNWTISRQRFFGVPVPCWYSKRKGEEGKVILPKLSQLPVDPTIDLPEGYSKDEVIGESDVFDTWMTSSVSPQLSIQAINEDFCCDKERAESINLPFDLRPQAHDIIRTWAFCTIAKAFYHENKIPWKNIFISGYCLASDGTKMSKSKGNGIDPIKILNEFGADPIRYWAGRATLGNDTPYSVDVIKNGQKLITKLFNSAKFCEMCFKNISNVSTAKEDLENGVIFEIIDKWLISRFKEVVEKTTNYFKNYEYYKAIEVIENFFWNDLCDNYLEIVKTRCYGASGFKYKDLELSNDDVERINKEQQSAIRTIYYVFNGVLKLFAPFMPSITDEIYSCIYEDEFNATKSVNSRGNWVNSEMFISDNNAEKIGNIFLKILANVRKYKADKNISIKEKIEKITIYSDIDIKEIEEDLKDVCNVENVIFNNGSELKVEY